MGGEINYWIAIFDPLMSRAFCGPKNSCLENGSITGFLPFSTGSINLFHKLYWTKKGYFPYKIRKINFFSRNWPKFFAIFSIFDHPYFILINSYPYFTLTSFHPAGSRFNFRPFWIITIKLFKNSSLIFLFFKFFKIFRWFLFRWNSLLIFVNFFVSIFGLKLSRFGSIYA